MLKSKIQGTSKHIPPVEVQKIIHSKVPTGGVYVSFEEGILKTWLLMLGSRFLSFEQDISDWLKPPTTWRIIAVDVSGYCNNHG